MTILQIRININEADGSSEGGIAVDKLTREDANEAEEAILQRFYEINKAIIIELSDAISKTHGSEAGITIIGKD